MEENNNTPGTGLTVIEGGRGKGTKRTGNKATPAGGLTEKQEAFAQLLAQGLTNAEAYRKAYDASSMKETTIWTESCKQAQHPKVSARLHELLMEKRQGNSMLTLKASDRVWRGVWKLAESEDVPPAVRASALSLAAKMAGMLTDQVRVESVSADSKTLEAELLERLQRLTA